MRNKLRKIKLPEKNCWEKYKGSMFAASSKEKTLRIFDPRQSKMTSSTAAHDGSKGFKVTWLGNSDMIATVGHSKSKFNLKRKYLAITFGWRFRQFSCHEFVGCQEFLNTRQICRYRQWAWSYYPLLWPWSEASVHGRQRRRCVDFFDMWEILILWLPINKIGNIKMYELEENYSDAYFLSEHRTAIPAAGCKKKKKIFIFLTFLQTFLQIFQIALSKRWKWMFEKLKCWECWSCVMIMLNPSHLECPESGSVSVI